MAGLTKIKKVRTPSTGGAGMSMSDDLIPDNDLLPDDLDELDPMEELGDDLQEMFEEETTRKEEPPISAADRERLARQAFEQSSMQEREFSDLEGRGSSKKRKVHDPRAELIGTLSVIIITFLIAAVLFGIAIQDYKSDAATSHDPDTFKDIKANRAWYNEQNKTVVYLNVEGAESGDKPAKAYKEGFRMDGDWARVFQAGPITIVLNWVYYMVLGLVVITGPNGIIRRNNINKLKAKEAKFPDFIRDLAEFWKGGLSMKVAVDTLAKGDYGALDEEVEFMATQLSWGVSFNEVLQMFLQRVHTGLIERSIALIEEANKAGGKISDILLNVAHDAQDIKMLDREREGTMKSYIFVTFISFLIYVIIIVIMSYVFLPAIADSTADLDVEGGFGNVRIQSFEATFIALLFFSSVLIQSIGGGVNAGIMGEGNVGASLWYITLFTLTGAVIFQLAGVELGLG